LGCRGFNKRKAADTREDCGGISGENLGSDLGPQGPEAQWTAATTPPTDASRAHAAGKVAALLLRGGGERSPPQGASVDVDAPPRWWRRRRRRRRGASAVQRPADVRQGGIEGGGRGGAVGVVGLGGGEGGLDVAQWTAIDPGGGAAAATVAAAAVRARTGSEQVHDQSKNKSRSRTGLRWRALSEWQVCGMGRACAAACVASTKPALSGSRDSILRKEESRRRAP